MRRRIDWSYELFHPKIRDLAWSVFSPSILDSKSTLDVIEKDFLGISKAAMDDFRTHLLRLERNPALFVRELQEASSKKLGNYFEDLIGYWLAHTNSCHKLERNIIIKQRMQTIGEFDFLFFSDEIAKAVHYEVSVKFYLLNGNPTDTASFIGINPEDTLEHKITTIKHQLILSQTPQARRFLERHNLTPIDAAALFKGYLFYPLEKDATFKPQYPTGVSPHHLNGFWDREDSMLWKNRLQSHGDKIRLMLPSKLDWLSPRIYENHHPSFHQESYSFDTLPKIKPPFLITVFAYDDDFWQEIERGLIVKNTWPEISTETTF